MLLEIPSRSPATCGVLIVGADADYAETVARSLGDGICTRIVASGSDALEELRRTAYALLIVAEPVSGMSAEELLRQSAVAAPDVIRIAVGNADLLARLEKESKAYGLFAVMPRASSVWSLQLLIRRALDAAQLVADNARLQWLSQYRYKGSLRAISAALDAQDAFTRGHSYRVTQYALAIAYQMGLPTAGNDDLEIGGMLHDIGKIGIPEAILRNPGKLSGEEFNVIKTHPMRGYHMLMTLPGMENVLRIVRHHHERYDGAGYPDGLAGEAIPVLACVLAVADAYDAMTSARAYRPAMTHTDALLELKRNAGTQFDPLAVKAFAGLREKAEVRQVLQQAPDLPAFSPAVFATQRMLSQAEPELRDLANVISSDQAISGKVLRLVNSAHYSLSRNISDVGQAVALIGLRDLHRLLVTIAAQPLLTVRKGYDLWFHSLVCAVGAEILAQRTSDIDPGEAFTAGLLHDVGISLFQRYFPGSYERVIQLERSGMAGFSSEVVVFGVDHASVGAWLLETWGLDGSLCDAVRDHHDPSKATRPICCLVALANCLAHDLDAQPSLRYIEGEWLDRFRIAPEDIGGIVGQIRERSEQYVASVHPVLTTAS
jgi:putative nucleotidyltransferase with HDIG domain